MQLSTGPRWPIAFGVFVTLALIVRLALAWADPPGPTWVDGEQYWSISRNLAASGAYSNAAPEPPGDRPYADVGPTSFWLPGYPLMLAAVILVFGEFPRAVYVVQAILSTLTVVVVGSLAHRLGGWAVGASAAALIAISPLQLVQIDRFASELLVALVLAVQVWLWDEVLESVRAGRSARWQLLGLWIVSAFGVLLRSVFAPIGVLVVCWVLAAQLRRGLRREAWLGAGLAVVVGLFVLLPWFARNLELWGEPVYNTKAGINLRIGFNEFADGRYATRGVPRLDRASTNELTRDRALREQAISWIRENPAPAAVLALRKFALFFSPFHDVHPVSTPTGAIVFAWSALLLGTATCGALVAVRRDWVRFAPLIALILLYAAVHVAAFSAVRFRIPLCVVLAVFSSYGIVHLYGRARSLRTSAPTT